MDADVLAVGPDLNEVRECAANNVAFTMAADDFRFTTLRETAEAARKLGTDRAFLLAERYFDQLPDRDRRRYVRGSSGLAGFAKGGFERSEIESFHTIMQSHLGERWKEWGSEQVASNFAVANSKEAVVLPYPAYASYPSVDLSKSKLFHFIGAYRFDDGYFAAKGKEFIRAIARAPGGSFSASSPG